MFTGLSRKYIAALRNGDFLFEDGLYKIRVWKDDREIILPVKAELQVVINEYCLKLPNEEMTMRVIKIDENALSTYVTNLVESIIAQHCTPTILSNTFINKALKNGNCIWEISRLTLESVGIISGHVVEDENLSYRQTSILNSF